LTPLSHLKSVGQHRDVVSLGKYGKDGLSCAVAGLGLSRGNPFMCRAKGLDRGKTCLEARKEETRAKYVSRNLFQGNDAREIGQGEKTSSRKERRDLNSNRSGEQLASEKSERLAWDYGRFRTQKGKLKKDISGGKGGERPHSLF